MTPILLRIHPLLSATALMVGALYGAYLPICMAHR
jgi:hypothetical protein